MFHTSSCVEHTCLHRALAVWLSVLQCVAVCCSVVQCVAVCYSVMQGVAAHDDTHALAAFLHALSQ